MRIVEAVMKIYLSVLSMLALGLAPLCAQDRQSGLNNDPEVYYFDDSEEKEKITLLVAEPTRIFRDKGGRSAMRTLEPGTLVELVAMNERAYRVRGGNKYNGFVGWVNPHDLASKDPEFLPKLKSFYKREMEVRDLIANREVAIGMTSDEVTRSLGEPTKTSVKVTAEGQTSLWEFITYTEQQHYTTYADPLTGAYVRRYSHTTREETGKISLEFQDDTVTSIERTEQQGGNGNVKIIARPLVLTW